MIARRAAGAAPDRSQAAAGDRHGQPARVHDGRVRLGLAGGDGRRLRRCCSPTALFKAAAFMVVGILDHQTRHARHPPAAPPGRRLADRRSSSRSSPRRRWPASRCCSASSPRRRPSTRARRRHRRLAGRRRRLDPHRRLQLPLRAGALGRSGDRAADAGPHGAGHRRRVRGSGRRAGGASRVVARRAAPASIDGARRRRRGVARRARPSRCTSRCGTASTMPLLLSLVALGGGALLFAAGPAVAPRAALGTAVPGGRRRATGRRCAASTRSPTASPASPSRARCRSTSASSCSRPRSCRACCC